MSHRNWFRTRRSKESAGGSYDDVSFGPVEPGRHYTIQRYAVEDENSALTGDIRVFVAGHGYNHYLVEKDTPAAAELVWENEPTHLFEGETLTARFTGATSGDDLHLYLEGWWEEVGEGGDWSG